MIRTVLISICLLPGVFFSAVLDAQQAKKERWTIGYLSNSDPGRESFRSESIGKALRNLGYVEGKTIRTEYRFSGGKPSRAFDDAAELVRLKVDLIVVAGGPTWVQAAQKATATIPIVMVGAGADPVQILVTDEHLKLLQHASIRWTDWPEELGDDAGGLFAVPGFDPKRPYGNFTSYELEMALHLGIPVEKGADGAAILPAKLRNRMQVLHEDMQAVLQVFVQRAEIAPGRYVGNGYGHWERQQRLGVP